MAAPPAAALGGLGSLFADRRWFLWFVVIENTLFGGVLFVVAVWGLVGPPGEHTPSVSSCVVVAVIGAGWVAMSVVVYRMYLYHFPADGRRVMTTTVDGVPAVVVRWRTTFLRQPIAMQAFVAMVAGGVSAIMLHDGNPRWWILFVLVVVPFVLVLPDELIQVSRDARLVLTPQGIGVRGWNGDSWLDWDDVEDVVVVHDHPNWTTLRVLGVPHSSSWRWHRRRRILFLLARQPRGEYIDIPGPALDVNAGGLADAILYYAGRPQGRDEIGKDTARIRIVESVRHPL